MSFYHGRTRQSARQATMVYGPHAVPPTEIERVVACVDGSDFSELSVDEGSLWSVALAVPLWIVQVVPPDLEHRDIGR